MGVSVCVCVWRELIIFPTYSISEIGMKERKTKHKFTQIHGPQCAAVIISECAGMRT